MKESNETISRSHQSLLDSSSEKGSVRASSLEPAGVSSPLTPSEGIGGSDCEREPSVDPSLHDVMSLSSDHDEKPIETITTKSVSN